MRKSGDNKWRAIRSAFKLVVFVFLMASLALLLWLLPKGASPTGQMQNQGQAAPIPTIIVIDTPTVLAVETVQVVTSTEIVVVHIMPIVPQLGVVIDEKQIVVEVEPGSAGEKAGVQPGDILEHIEDMPLLLEEDRIKAKHLIGYNLEGKIMHLTVIRAGETLELPFVPGPPMRDQQGSEEAAKQEPIPTITPVLPPYYYF